MVKALTVAAVIVVTAIAAVISFGHIEALALAHGQSHVASLLLPLSVDGCVAAASLAMLTGARAGHVHWLSRVMLLAGVIATLTANALSGVSHGAIGIAVATWPAVAFVGTVELMIVMARRSGVTAPATEPVTVPTVTKPPVRPVTAPADGKVAVVIASHPEASVAELADLAGVSESTVYRAKRSMNGNPARATS